MKLLFMGPPGAGKGTQAKVIAAELGVPTVSTGDILRASIKNGTKMGLEAKAFMEAGKLVPDEVVIGIIEDRLRQDDASGGFILDGFPRTLQQANALKSTLAAMGRTLDAAVNLAVGSEELVNRLLDRARKEGRADDTEPVIKQRLKTYEDQTRPLIDYYRSEGLLKEVEGLGSLEEITGRIRKVLGR